MSRRPLVLLWLAGYAAIALCSPAMHELTGVGHGVVPSAASRSAVPAFQDDPASPTVDATAIHEGHCPVCFYLAQAQAAPDVVPAIVVERVVFASEVRVAARPRRALLLSPRPRAPPRPALARV